MSDFDLFEVFVRPKAGLDHRHVGSVHASDKAMALTKARELYTRRMEGVSLWVMRSADIAASDPADHNVMFEPAKDKVYRHPTFYTVPDGIENI